MKTPIEYRLATPEDAPRVAEVLERSLEDCRSLVAPESPRGCSGR